VKHHERCQGGDRHDQETPLGSTPLIWEDLARRGEPNRHADRASRHPTKATRQHNAQEVTGKVQDNTLARSLHDLGLAAWFGGSLMGAVGLNGAAAVVDAPEQRLRVANTGWARWPR
jgi:hypothetical protein